MNCKTTYYQPYVAKSAKYACCTLDKSPAIGHKNYVFEIRANDGEHSQDPRPWAW